MIEIEKLRQGRKVSINEYNQAKQEFDDLYANASDDDKAKIDGLMRSSQNYSSANPMNNRSTREYQTQVYKNASAILRGEMTPSMAPTVSTPNWFNGYSSEENQNNANYVTQRYLSHAGKPTTGTTNVSTPRGTYYQYNWANGLSSGWTLDSDTLEQRMQSFADTLSSNLNSALSAKNSGKKLVGVDEDKVEIALSMLQGKQWTRENFKDLMKAAQLAGVEASAFRDYFGDLFPGMSAEDRAKKVWTDKGYTEVDISGLSEGIKSILNSNNVRLLKDKDNNYTLAGKDWSEYSGNGFNWIDLNQGDTYGHGILAGTDGKVFIGNTADINDSHWANELFSGIKNNMYEQYNPVYTRKKFNLGNDYSEETLINEYIKGLESLGYKNPDASYTDVSKLFNGTSKVIAYNPDGSELGTGSFGELILSPNTQFIWENADGTISKPSTLEEAKKALGGFSLKGYDNEANEQLGALTDLSNIFEGAEGLNNDTKFRSTNWKNVIGAGLVGAGAGAVAGLGVGSLPGAAIGFVGTAGADLIAQYFQNDSIGNKPQEFVNAAVQALKDPQKKIKIPGSSVNMTGSEFIAQFGTRTQLLETIGRFVNEGAKLSPKDLRWIKNMYYTAEKTRLDSEAKTRKHAQGGILYAADGTALFVNQEIPTNNWHEKYDKSKALKKEDVDIEAAQREGYKSAEHYRANKDTKFTTADKMRVGTIAADITSIIASFTSGTGAGAFVAETAGLASFGIDTAADLIDPSVSSGEVLKNGLINAGLAAVSFIPGAKIHSTLAKVAKYAPKVLLAASAMGMAMDESVQNTFKKVTDGKEKLNTEDWKNIAHVFTLVAAGSRAGRQGYEKFRAKKDLTGKAKDMLSVKSGDTLIGEIAANKKSELDAIEQLAKDGVMDGPNGAYNKLAKLLKKPEADIKQFFTQNGRLQKGKYSLNLKASEEKPGLSIDKALEAFENAKYSGNSTWARLRNAPTWRQRGIIDATGIYPNGIIGNKRTEGVSERMRAEIGKQTSQQEATINQQSSTVPQSSYPTHINNANNVTPTQNQVRLNYSGHNVNEITPNSRALAIRSNTVSPATQIRERLALPQNRMLPEGQKVLPQGQLALPESKTATRINKGKSTRAINAIFKGHKRLTNDEILAMLDKMTDSDLAKITTIENGKQYPIFHRTIFGVEAVPFISSRISDAKFSNNKYALHDLLRQIGIFKGNRSLVDVQGQLSFDFKKDGGKVNYQKLRK